MHPSQHQRQQAYPLLALREAVVNAICHRDYFYDGGHTYIHWFQDRIVIESPGGLCHGIHLQDLGHRSVRRNRLIADLLHRTGYIERVGSGFDRMRHALQENNNPPLEVDASNFFIMTFYPQVQEQSLLDLTPRQRQIYALIAEQSAVSQKQISTVMNISRDTTIREIKALMDKQLIEKQGIGKSTTYRQLKIIRR